VSDLSKAIEELADELEGRSNDHYRYCAIRLREALAANPEPEPEITYPAYWKHDDE
jgi:hypothetical protein